MTRGLFVAGTDTGVGKTVVTAGLTGWLRDAGIEARAVKPAQTGYPPDDDAGMVAETCDDADAATCLRRLEPALAPRVAAEREGVDLSYEAIREGCERVLSEPSVEAGIVEGIGGLRVPLAGDREVIDLVADLDLPTVVVARSGLGTLNHTALTVSALERRGVEVPAILLNEYEGASVAERTNPAEIERMTGVGVETMPQLDLSDPSAAIGGLRDAVDEWSPVDAVGD
ncbi:dethiobiotin synthetase [Natronoarchaeum philippinense]|uniref:ATP-dependent dethiobiotin synthetase BioD n=1 Tax=Natronoarchaeum philippinense TaxID=558529 RepID=A0A285N8K5_NATPI|nr:dethiobiotin synthase [Natronoarchaeum philippinense]SNZ05648.1 dethiobiotin synthetase [Natronoarchaeum philippinense]